MSRILHLALAILMASSACQSQDIDQTEQPAPLVDAEKLAEQFRQSDAEGRFTLLKQLCGMGASAAPAVPLVARVMLDSRMDANLRYEAAATLGKLGEVAKGAVLALVTALDDRDPHLRGWAAYALAGIGPASKDAVAKLRQCLRDEKSGVVRNAAHALGSIGADAAQAEADLASLQQSQDEGLRRAAATALKQIEVSRERP